MPVIQPWHVSPRRLLSALVVWGMLSGALIAQTSPGAVIETGRNGRMVSLTLRSGPHPYVGDYPVTVYLPPTYDAETARYPVIYIFDGYDFHDAHDGLCAENLIQPAILVSIQNKTGNSRTYDLTPSEVWGYGYSGGLPVFAELITRDLKAYVDSHFRTRSEAASTGVVGVSLGGLAACWLGYMQPETFGLAGVLEPSLWWNNSDLLYRLQRDTTPKFATRFWMMAADQEYPSMWQNAKYGAYALTQRGWREGQDVAFIQVHNYSHGGAAAYVQLRDMLHFLLRTAPVDAIGAVLTNCHGPQQVPLRPDALGGAAYAYLDVQYEHGLRTTAIAPPLVVGDETIVALYDPVLGELLPIGRGWTTVTATFQGFRTIADVQGFSAGTAVDPPARPAPPSIRSHPASVTVTPGSAGGFAVTGEGAGTLTYQWRFDGSPILGGTTAALAFASTVAANGGRYDVIVANELGGSTVSRPARLVVATPEVGRLANMSVRSVIGHDGQPLIVGFVVAGGECSLLLRAVGPTLATALGVNGVAVDPRVDVHQPRGGIDCIAASNDNWGDNGADCPALAAAFGRVGAFPLPASSRDAALVVGLGGLYTVHASNRVGDGPGIALVEGYDLGTGVTGRLINVSARNWVGTGSDILIAGFVINGNVPKRMLIRGVGPALSTLFGIPTALTGARLELHATVNGRDAVFATNDNWAAEPDAATAGTRASAFPLPLGSRDSALVVTLPAGAYTAQLSGVEGATGEGLIEVYEVSD